MIVLRYIVDKLTLMADAAAVTGGWILGITFALRIADWLWPGVLPAINRVITACSVAFQ